MRRMGTYPAAAGAVAGALPAVAMLDRKRSQSPLGGAVVQVGEVVSVGGGKWELLGRWFVCSQVVDARSFKLDRRVGSWAQGGGQNSRWGTAVTWGKTSSCP